MLAKRIIPCLDVTGGRVVKGVNFVELRDAGDPVEIAARYNEQGADELTFLDITATSDGRDLILPIIEAVASQVFIPLTVGGGVRTVEDVRRLLNAGADKVSFNSAAVADPQVIRAASDRYGAQCIVVAIDAKRRVDVARSRPRLGRLHPRRAPQHRPGRGRMGREDGRTRRRRDPAHQHGPRRHARRLRPGAHPRRRRRGAGAGDRLGRRRLPRSTWRTASRWAAPTQCWPRASSTTASTPCAKPRRCWRRAASRCGSEVESAFAERPAARFGRRCGAHHRRALAALEAAGRRQAGPAADARPRSRNAVQLARPGSRRLACPRCFRRQRSTRLRGGVARQRARWC